MNVTLQINSGAADLPVAALRHPSIAPTADVTVWADGHNVGTLRADVLREAMRQFRMAFAMGRDPRDDMADHVVAVIVADQAGWSDDPEQLIPAVRCMARSNTPQQLLGWARWAIPTAA